MILLYDANFATWDFIIFFNLDVKNYLNVNIKARNGVVY